MGVGGAAAGGRKGGALFNFRVRGGGGGWRRHSVHACDQGMEPPSSTSGGGHDWRQRRRRRLHSAVPRPLLTWPTRRSPVLVKATTEGVVRPPSALVMIVGLPPSIAATAEFVVPRSMPTTCIAGSIVGGRGPACLAGADGLMQSWGGPCHRDGLLVLSTCGRSPSQHAQPDSCALAPPGLLPVCAVRAGHCCPVAVPRRPSAWSQPCL